MREVIEYNVLIAMEEALESVPLQLQKMEIVMLTFAIEPLATLEVSTEGSEVSSQTNLQYVKNKRSSQSPTLRITKHELYEIVKGRYRDLYIDVAP